MAAKDRIIEVVYRLKDLFSKDVGKITSSFDKVGDASDKSSKDLEKNNDRLAKSFRGVATAAAGAGLATGTAALAGLRNLARELDVVVKTADKLGVSTEELSKLNFAAELSGISSNTLGTALQRLTRRVSEAASGTGEARGALQELTLSAQELEELSPDQQFLRIADALSSIPSQTDRVRLAFKLFDTEGVALLNLTANGSQGIRELGDEFERLGGVIDEDAARAAVEFNDSLTRLNANINAFKLNFGPAALGILNDSFEFYGLTARTNIEQIREELAQLGERRDELLGGRSLFDALFGPDQASRIAELEQIGSRVDELTQRRLALNIAERDSIRNSEALADRQSDLDAATKANSDSLELATKSLEANTSALEAARAASRATKDEFEALFDEIEDSGDREVGVLDVFDAISRAQDALRAGDVSGSLEVLRAAGEDLKTLKEEGEVADISLQDLARSLQRIAGEAADAQVDEELINVERSQQVLDDLEKAKEDLQSGEAITFIVESDPQAATESAVEAVKAADDFINGPGGETVKFAVQPDLDAVGLSSSEIIQRINAQFSQSGATVPVQTQLDTTAIDNFQPPTITVPVVFDVVGGIPGVDTLTDTTSRESTKRGFRP